MFIDAGWKIWVFDLILFLVLVCALTSAVMFYRGKKKLACSLIVLIVLALFALGWLIVSSAPVVI